MGNGDQNALNSIYIRWRKEGKHRKNPRENPKEMCINKQDVEALHLPGAGVRGCGGASARRKLEILGRDNKML